MKKSTFARRLAVLSLVSGLAWASPGEIVTVLEASGPHRSEIFGGLVGTWNVEYADFLKDGTVKHASGEFIVGWVMDGLAIQGIFTIYPSEAGCRETRVSF